MNLGPYKPCFLGPILKGKHKKGTNLRDGDKRTVKCGYQVNAYGSMASYLYVHLSFSLSPMKAQVIMFIWLHVT